MLKQTSEIRVGHFIAKEKTANHEWVMEVPDLIEEVDLVFARKKRCANAVNRRVAPTLLKELQSGSRLKAHCRCLTS
jgi:RNase P protein component